MNVFAEFTGHVRAAVEALAQEGRFALPATLDKVTVEPPRDAAHGDLATNAAMVLAKDVGLKPRDLAEALAGKLRAMRGVTRVEIAGPGFINLALDPAVWRAALAAAIAAGDAFGASTLGGNAAVNVEYVSANPTGPMHVGHCRGAVFGDALAALLARAGFAVTREYYINDAGAQVDVLARSAFLRYREACGEDVGAIPDGLYPGDYLKPVGQALKGEFGTALLDLPESEWLAPVRERAIAMMMQEIRGDLAALGVTHDVFFSERSLARSGGAGAIAETIADLREQGLIYEGVLPPPKGAPAEDYEEREQTLFRATAFGDDVDRPLMKSDGSYTYFAADIAYHRSKVDRGFSQQIDVWGADHGGYVKRMQAAVRAVSSGAAVLDVKIVQLVRLLRAGVPVKMSKRSGDFVTLRDVVNEVGRGAVRFMMLYRKNDATLDFDLAKAVEQSRDNPVFYVQYGHARAQSVLRKAAEAGLATTSSVTPGGLAPLADEAEVAVMRRIAAFPRLVEAAAAAHEPHRVAFYLYDLASDFHALWNKGQDAPHLRFIMQDDPTLTLARLGLVRGVATVLASGLRLLGVSAPDEMR